MRRYLMSCQRNGLVALRTSECAALACWTAGRQLTAAHRVLEDLHLEQGDDPISPDSGSRGPLSVHCSLPHQLSGKYGHCMRSTGKKGICRRVRHFLVVILLCL